MPSQKPMLRQIEWGVQNGYITKNAVLSVSTLFLGVGILAWKIRLAMTVVVESWITHYSLDPMVWPSNFHCLD